MKSKENILLVANWESNVGYAWWLMENFWLEIASHFEQQGKSCHLIYPKITQIPQNIDSSKISVHQCDFRNRTQENLSTLKHLIKENNIKFVYLSDSPAYEAFYLQLRLWGIKKIIIHDHTPGPRTIARGWRKAAKSLLQRIPYYTADHFIAVTQFVYERFINVYCIPEQKCSIAANGITPLELDDTDLQYINHSFSIPCDKHVIVTTGRATYYKGIDFIIECANELINNQGYNQLYFLFCGDGPDLTDFKILVKKYHLDKYFTFPGKRTDIHQILPACDIGFHAAEGEVGYSLSILEYMSAGLTTIVPDQPSTSLSINNMVDGILYTPRNLRSATDAIKISLDNKISQSLRENAVTSVRDNFNIKQTNKDLIKTLHSVIS